MLRWSLAAAALLAVSASTLLGPRTGAEPLPKEECDKIKGEHADLVTLGLRDQLSRGAEWGKANLTADQMQRVARFIALEEQLSFRCGLNQLRITLPVVEEGGEQELDENGQPIPAKKGEKDDQAKVKTKVKPAAKAADTKRAAAAPDAAPKPKAKPKDAAAGKAPESGKGQPPAAKAQVKAKPKVDDAYRPPQPKDAGADPFTKSGAPVQPKQ